MTFNYTFMIYIIHMLFTTEMKLFSSYLCHNHFNRCKLVPLLNAYFTVDCGSTCICYKIRSRHSSPPSLPGRALGWACLRNCKIMYHYTRILLKKKNNLKLPDSCPNTRGLKWRIWEEQNT